jgi:hypothetical protein
LAVIGANPWFLIDVETIGIEPMDTELSYTDASASLPDARRN